ncbi:MAG: hypothetical protein WC629_02955, partial [Candidatus Paceibacterota bacterium]
YFIENLFKVSGIPGSIILTLPLGYSIGTIINMILLWVSFKKDFGPSLNGLFKTLFHSFGVSIIMGFVAYLSLGTLSHFFNTATVLGIFLQGLIAGLVGIVAGIGLFSILKSPELKEIFEIIPRKILKEKNVVLDEVGKIE